MGKADIHIHTTHSDGMASVQQVFDFVENETDLDLIAITDHDMFDGADEARNLAARRNYRFQVLTGMEVTTIEGHLLVLGIDKPVRSLQGLDKSDCASSRARRHRHRTTPDELDDSLDWTERLAPHPLSSARRGCTLTALKR
jgi:predicted metal-dependent phosphoesterase TrpH